MSSTYVSLYVHAVFATKDRAPTIDADWRNRLHGYIGGIIKNQKACPLAIGGVADHVHVLFSLGATQNIADIIRETKKASSLWASQFDAGFAWQRGYGAFTIGANSLDALRQYIATQEEHHRTISSAEELKSLLAEFQVEYDPRYFE